MTTLTDRQTQHQVFIQRFGGGLTNRTRSFLVMTRRELLKLLDESNELSGASVTYITKTLKQIDDIWATNTADAHGVVEQEQLDFAEFEAKQQSRIYSDYVQDGVSFDLPAHDQIRGVVLSQPMNKQISGGLTIGEAFDKFAKGRSAEYSQIVKDGVIAGLTNKQIGREVKERFGLTSNQYSTLVRTTTNHTAGVAHDQFLEENDDIFDGFIWVATLDSRTSTLCASLDGKHFDYHDADAPQNPLHWGCRSRRVGNIKPQYRRGDINSTRASEFGQVDGKLTYEKWLRRQNKEFQNEVLGEERAKMFRSGRYKISQFLDSDLKPLTLEELKRK